MTISGKQLFDCQSNLISNKCIENFNIRKNIYANNEFGICFEFVGKNQTFYMEEKDFIEIYIKRKHQVNELHLLLLPDVYASYENYIQVRINVDHMG